MQPVLHGPRRNLRPGVKSEFVEDMLNVSLGGLLCDHEKRANLAVGVTARDLGRGHTLFMIPFIRAQAMEAEGFAQRLRGCE